MDILKLVAVDIDGVLLEDTFSPVLKRLVNKYGGEYSRDLERNMFSRPREEGATYFIEKMGIDISKQDIIDAFFKERELYTKENNSGIIEGVDDFLKLLQSTGVKMVCYGGLPETSVISEFKEYMHYFDQYICTDKFRPGLKEITKDIYDLEFHEVLFIDDVNTVAETARNYNIPFIGVPATFEWGWQRHDMIENKVKYILNSVKDINMDLLKQFDDLEHNKNIWNV